MAQFIARASLLAIFLAPSVQLQAASTYYSFSDANASKQITFDSKAPVENIHGVANEVRGFVNMDSSKPNLDLKASISVPVASMQTGIEMRDRHLQSADWLYAEKYPVILFELASIPAKSVVKKDDRTWLVKADGTLSIKSQTRKISVPVRLRVEGDKIHIDGRFNVRLDDYTIYGPAAIKMVGVKVSKNILVNFNLTGVADKGGWDVPVKKIKKAL